MLPPNVQIFFANGSSFRPIGLAEILIPCGHILQVLVCDPTDINKPIVSISQLGALGFVSHFSNTSVTLTYNGEPVPDGYGPLLDKETVYHFPVTFFQDMLSARPATPSSASTDFIVENVVSHQHVADRVAFFSAALGSHPDSTLIRALSRDYLYGIPITTLEVQKNKPNSMATAQGYATRQRQGIRSTRIPSTQLEPIPDDDAITEDDSIYCTAVAMQDPGTVFSDTSGQLPWRSIQGNTYVFLSCRLGYTHAFPMASRVAGSFLAAYRDMEAFWTAHGGKPTVLRTDNELSKAVFDHLEKHSKIRVETAPPNEHRTNRAERYMQTFKNALLSTLATAPDSCPASLWESFLPQIEICDNSMRPYALDPSISAYHGVHGARFDFKAHPIAPCGTIVGVYVNPENRPSFGLHVLKGYYMGPHLSSYRAFRVHIVDTNTERVSASVVWFSTYRMPGASDAEMLKAGITDFADVLARLGRHLSPDEFQSFTDNRNLLVKQLQRLADPYLANHPDIATPQYSPPAVLLPPAAPSPAPPTIPPSDVPSGPPGQPGVFIPSPMPLQDALAHKSKKAKSAAKKAATTAPPLQERAPSPTSVTTIILHDAEQRVGPYPAPSRAKQRVRPVSPPSCAKQRVSAAVPESEPPSCAKQRVSPTSPLVTWTHVNPYAVLEDDVETVPMDFFASAIQWDTPPYQPRPP
jgi:hypothetical protein